MTVSDVNHTLYPAQRIHIPAFFLAFILGPLVTTGATFWLVVPVFALVMGGPLYLIFGFPILLWHLSRNPCDEGRVAWIALLTNLFACSAFILLGLALGENTGELAIFYLGFGSVFAPLWAWMFAVLYNRFTRNAA